MNLEPLCRVPFAAAFAIWVFGSNALCVQSPQALPSRITKSFQLKTGIYHLSSPLVISGSNLVIDGNGATLIGNGSGTGLQIEAGQNITIKNLNVKAFHWGIIAENVKGLKLLHVASSGNQTHPEASVGVGVGDPLASTEPNDGGGILLRGVDGALLQGVHAHGEWNGLTLSGATKVVVEKCDFSKNSGTGVHLWNSSDNEIRDCQIVNVGYAPNSDAGQVTTSAPQAGVLIEHDSHTNRILANNLVRCLGNGVFIRASETTTATPVDLTNLGIGSLGNPRTVVAAHPSNGNVVLGNDTSLAGGCSIECHFGVDNQIINNIASFSQFGVNLDFSFKSSVKSNLVVGSKVAGFRVNNGWNNSFENNIVIRDQGADLALSGSNLGNENPSGDLRIFNNTFQGFGRAFQFRNTFPATVQANKFINADSAEPSDLAEVIGTSPLFILNETEQKTAPDIVMSLGNGVILPTIFDTLGGINLSRIVAGINEIFVEGSLSGAFKGEEFEIARLRPPAPTSIYFPPRTAPYVRVRGADATPSSFIARIGDSSLARKHFADASVNRDDAKLAVDGDWNTPGKSWQPTEESGQWWQTDLGQPSMVDGVAIATNPLNPNAFWSKFRILVSDSGDFAGEEQTVVTELNWIQRPGPTRLYRFPATRGRYLRITGDVGQKNVQLQEFGVYGEAIDR